MSRPEPSKTPKQVYDLVHQREIAIELLPDGEVKCAWTWRGCACTPKR